LLTCGGETDGTGSTDSGFDPPGNLSDATVAPDTDSASANGLPSQEADKLTDFVQNTGTSDGVSRGAAPSPTATLVALAAAGRNPADITLPTQGSEGTDPPAGSHEAESQSWGAWLSSKASSVTASIGQAASSFVSTIRAEAALLPGTLANLPAAYIETATSGAQVDSLAGAVEGAGNALVAPFGGRLQPGGPIYGNEDAYANGKIVGQGAVLAAETAAFVYGTAGLGAAALPAIAGAGAAGGGAAALVAGISTTEVLVASAGYAAVAGTGLYMAVSNAGNLGNQSASAGTPAQPVPSEGSGAAAEGTPLGFESAEQFQQATAELEDALAKSGIEDGSIGVRGSSVTGQSFRTGQQFGPKSDIDFFVESQQLTQGLKTQPNIPGFVHPDRIQAAFDPIAAWAEKWSQILGRKVSVGGFQPGTVPPGPIISP